MSPRKFGSGDKMEDWTRRVHDIMDEMRNRIFFDYRTTGAWQPTINLYETREAFYVCVELAGLDENAISVECLSPRRVRITGQRAQPRGAGMEAPFSVEIMEIDEGPFCREVDLPDAVTVDAVEASYDKGYLWITLPKSETA